MSTRRLQRGRNGLLPLERGLRIAALSLVFGGCAAPIEGGETQEHVGQAIQPIVGGAASGTDQDAVIVLARFENGARVGLCTATLVAANLLVTARHCVSATDPSAACDASGQPVVGAGLHGDRPPASLAVFTATGGIAPVTTADVGAKAHGKALVVDASTTICNRDLAFVILDQAIAGPVAPVRLAAPSMSAPVTAVGFGVTEIGALPASRMQRAGLSLVGAGPMAYPEDARYGVGDAEFLLGESACAGDSGGPALAPSGAVMGVASRAGNGQPRDPSNIASTCLGPTAHAVYAQLGAHKALVARAFAEAGAKPWLEGDPDPQAMKDGSNKHGTGPRSASAIGESEAMGDGVFERAAAAPRFEAELAGAPSQSESGGCSATGEPARGAVEHAFGIMAGLVLALRLRSARRRRDEDQRVSEIPDGRLPYRDLGMRESLASLPDDR